MKARPDEIASELSRPEAREEYGIQRLKARRAGKAKRPSSGPKPGVREEKKAAKLSQIKSAATKLFLSKGYEKTTLREIAQQADVGLGTIFFYADDKREILLMVFADVMKRAIRRGLYLARPNLPLIDQLQNFFGEYYKHYEKHPDLARSFQAEMNFYSSDSKKFDRVQPTRLEIVQHIADLIERAKAAKRIATETPSNSIAWAILFLYLGAVRHWLGQPKPRAQDGILELRRLLIQQIIGMVPSRAEVRASAR